MKPAGETGQALAEICGVWGEWAHYTAAVWMAYTRGGVPLVAAYLIVSSVPALLWARPAGPYRWMAPAGLAGLAVGFGHLPAAALLLLGAAVGVGNAASGRPPAWTSGITGASAHGAAGALATGLLISAGLGRGALIGAAVAALIGSASSISSARLARLALRGGLGAGLGPAATGLAAVVGLRVFEPSLVAAGSTGGGAGPVGTASFAAAWALGSTAGWRLGPRADLRALLSAPFVGAAAVALFTVAKGPGLLLLHFLIAGCVGLAAGGGGQVHGSGLWRGRRTLWLATAGQAAAVAWLLPRSPAGFEDSLWLAAAAALLGGFTSLAAFRRKAAVVEQPPFTVPEPIEQPLPQSTIEEPDEEEVATAITLLRDALIQARTIRTEALRTMSLNVGTQTFDHVRSRVRAIADDLDSGIGKAAAATRGWRSALEPGPRGR